MSYIYNKSHRITFFKKIKSADQIEEMLLYDEVYPDGYKKYVKNTWDDWRLIPLSPPIFSVPRLKESYIDIPGMNGIIDLSNQLSGYPVYSNRTGSIEFYAINENWNEDYWSKIYGEISNFFDDSFEIYAILDDDKSYYFKGKFYLNDVKSDKVSSKIVISYNIYPFKSEIISTSYFGKRSSDINEIGATWLWDPFDFKFGRIQEIGNYRYNYDHLEEDNFKLYSIGRGKVFNENEDPHFKIFLNKHPKSIKLHLINFNETNSSDWTLVSYLKNKNGESKSIKSDVGFEEFINGQYSLPYDYVIRINKEINIEEFNELYIYVQYNKDKDPKPYITLSISYRGECL